MLASVIVYGYVFYLPYTRPTGIVKAKLTIKLVGSLKPKAKIYDVYDTEISGFVLRVRPSGLMTYLFFYRNAKGQKRTHTIGKGLSSVQARDIAKRCNAEVAHGIDINAQDNSIKKAATKAKASTLIAFLENIYKAWLIDNRRSGQDAYERLVRSFPTLADKQLDQITSWDIVIWRKAQKKKGLSEQTSKRNLAELKSMVGYAKKWGFVATNPLADVSFGKLEDNRTVRYLGDSERKRLYAALDSREQELRTKRTSGNVWREQRGYELMADHSEGAFADYLKPMVILALNTGLRRGELFALRWSDVNLSNKQLTVTSKSAKSKKARYIPLNTDTHATIQQWHSQRGERTYVFSGKEDKPLTNVRKSWGRVLKIAKIEDFRFHDQRHDFASQLVRRGVDLYVVKELLGHSTIQVTERYAHLAPKQLEDAVNLLND
jgi:integrase